MRDKFKNMIKYSLYFFIAILILSMNLCAQTLSPSVLATTGGSSSGNELSWTVGETFTETFTGGSNILTQGFQQPELQLNMGSVPTDLCAGAQFSIPYTACGIIRTSNVFSAVLSDKYGNFDTASVIGSVTSNISGIINATIPNSIASGSQYRIRVVSSSPVFSSNDNGTRIKINSTPCYQYLKATPTQSASSIDNLVVTVMPNPSSTNFRLNIQGNGSAPVNVRITDVTGRVFETQNKQVFKLTNITVTLGDNYKPGTYFAEVTQGTNRRIVTLIKL